jgi:hypothetical protein
MASSTDITRAQIEHQTALLEYQRARLELAAKACCAVVAALTLATTVVAGVAAIVLALITRAL